MNHFEVDKKTHYSLYQLLVELTRTDRFNMGKISEKIKDELLKETYTNSNGDIKKMFIYPSPAGITTRNFISIYREAIPQFLKKWGSFFQVPDHIIKTIENTQNLPDISHEMITIFDFCKKTNSPHSLAFWIEQNAFTLLKNKNPSIPFFALAKDVFMFKCITLIKKNLAHFVLSHQEILKFHGLPQKVIDHAKNGTLLTYLEESQNLKYTKETEVETPMFRVDELCKKLKKANSFIPYLRKFIVQNCLNDTFDLKIENMPPIQIPMFSYFVAFKKDKSSCYIYKKALPHFVQKHENELIGLGVKHATLNDILKKHNLRSKFTSKIISFQEAYLLSMPNIEYSKFRRILKTATLPNDESLEDGIVFVETTKKDPYYINTTSLIEILKNQTDELGMPPQAIERVEMLIQSPQKAVIPVSYFLKNIGISVQKAAAFNTKILKPNKNKTLTYVNHEGQTQKIIPFGHAKTASGQIFIGVFLEATDAIIQNFNPELKELGFLKKTSKQTTKEELSTQINIKIATQFKTLKSLLENENEKES